MKNRTKKWLVVAGCLMICAVLVVLIGGSFSKEPVQDDPLPVLENTPGGVTVDPGTQGNGAGNDSPPAVVVKPETQAPTGSGAVYTGTEQTIQPDVTKPEYDEETLKDPTKTPDGKPVSEPPQHVDHDAITPPPAAEKPSGGGTSGGLPGFDNVPNAGANQGTKADGEGDINKQVGIME